jgi:hypothetical protein
MVRVADKVQRLKTYCRTGRLVHEGVRDTLLDMAAYSLLAIKTCHKRGAQAMGGMAAQIPIKNDPEANEAAIAKVRADKEREAGDGHDGTWVAHPGLVPIAMDAFDAVLGDKPNQVDRLRDDVHVTGAELLDFEPEGPITEAGLRTNVNVGIQYLGAWLAGVYAPLGQAALPPMQFNSFVAGIGIGLVSVAYPSMMADAADEHEYLFGRRREGLYFAGLGFANKAAVGVGVLLAGVALDLIRFPREIGQTVGAVLSHEVQVRLVLVWGPIPAVIAVASMVIFASYGITRSRHAAIAAALRGRDQSR